MSCENIMVLQFNTNKIDLDTARSVFMDLNDKLAMEFKENPLIVAIPDGMSLMSFSLDELKEYYEHLGEAIKFIESERSEHGK